jgi:O-acetyl-ADP-ribose deacetylase (regulator of RNase III)
MRLAAPIALETIVEFLAKERHNLSEVRLVLYTREDETAYAVHAQAMQSLMEKPAWLLRISLAS